MTADAAFDVQLLQTGASVENVLVSAYDAIIGTPLFSGTTANAVLRGWAVSFRDQHADHARACNDLATRLGGRAQPGLNPAMAQVLSRARGGVGDHVAAFELLIELENASAQTHQNSVGLIGDLNARRLAGSIMCVEAQHAGALHVARVMASARLLDLMAMETGATARLPTDAGTTGMPEAFASVDQARPAAEGAVR